MTETTRTPPAAQQQPQRQAQMQMQQQALQRPVAEPLPDQLAGLRAALDGDMATKAKWVK
jgi:hypothetical protein